jgi:hypothetical protein
VALFNLKKSYIHMLGTPSWRLDGWIGRGISYVCVAFGLDGKNGMGSVYDCLLHLEGWYFVLVCMDLWAVW